MQSEVGLMELSNICSGVPHGSILSPTLCLIFIIDLPLHFEFCLLAFYADDATVHTNDKELHTIEYKLQGELGNANHWNKQNKLPLN